MLTEKLVPHFVLSCGLITITNVFIKTVLNHSHYASSMLDAFRDLLHIYAQNYADIIGLGLPSSHAHLTSFRNKPQQK